MRVEQRVPVKNGDLIRYDYHEWKYQKERSNIDLLDKDGNIIWNAEIPDPMHDVYANEIFDICDDSFWTVSVSGWECNISLENGKIISKTWGK
jgi:hypothetical protein